MSVEKFSSGKTLGNRVFMARAFIVVLVAFMLFMVAFITDFFIGKAIWRDEAENDI